MLGVGRKNHHRKNGKAPLPPFWSQNRLIPCLLTTSHLSGGDLFITSLGTKDKRPAAICDEQLADSALGDSSRKVPEPNQKRKNLNRLNQNPCEPNRL